MFDKNIIATLYSSLDINQNPTLQNQVIKRAQESLGSQSSSQYECLNLLQPLIKAIDG